MSDRLVGGGQHRRDSQRYWLWTALPEFYLLNGKDHRDLTPRDQPDPEAWWTCTRTTRCGDLALLYRAENDARSARITGVPGKDIAFLIEVCSNPFSLDDEIARKYKWKTGCDFRVIEKFQNPLRLDEMRKDPELVSWRTLRGNFQGKAREVAPDIWNHLLARLRSR
jgi:hypothetical protein